MLLAVLDARAGFSFGSYDVFLSVIGGLKIQEPAADLAVASALISALMNRALPHDAVFFGEISLSGTIRSVPQAEGRLKESEKLGFREGWVPPNFQSSVQKTSETFKVRGISDVTALSNLIRNI
jgi:DNA repair protein RadA/Sms